MTRRELEVLGLMAQGRTNASIATELVVTEGAIERHSQRIFAELNLAPGDNLYRRVSAVLTYLRS